MKIIFHERYYNSRYAGDPAAAPGRLENIMETIHRKQDEYDILVPEPASEEDILRAHSRSHVNYVQENPLLYELASLAAGGAIMAAEEAYEGSPAFAVIRPPGHHASGGSCWGFCYFNNMSVSLLKLFAEKKIKSAFVLDFDLHTGDGNINILEERDDGFAVTIHNPDSHERGDYLSEVARFMGNLEDVDIFAASAGFDQGINDWGNLLHEEDYLRIGELMKEYSEELCSGRRYAIFEGGYHHPDLGKHVDAFCGGFR
ncbi:MAG: histone deacetylase family protein [bacterium]|nr:histone deacetylase family protein [bacterium]